MNPVACPHCGHASIDAEFCDACNREISAPSTISNSPPAQIELPDGTVVECPFHQTGWPAANRPQFRAVTWSAPRYGRMYAIPPHSWAILQPLVEERARVKLRVLPPVHVSRIGDGAIITAESWTRDSSAIPLPVLSATTPFSDAWAAIAPILRVLDGLMSELHAHGLVWLNFNPAAIEMRDNEARITNLDTILFHSRECPDQLQISPQYSPPELCRFQAGRIGPASDVYQLALFLYYALAGLLPAGFTGKGLEAFSFQIPPLRIYRPDLPVGIWPVLSRALAVDPDLRQPAVNHFITDLESAIRESTARSQWADSFMIPEIEAGQLSIVGAAKKALGAVNQDAIATETIACGESSVLVAVVADGVSVSRIGSGDQASQIACNTILKFIRETLAASTTICDWPTILEAACLQATEQIVLAAQQLLDTHPPSAQDQPPAAPLTDSDAMSTTAVIAVWDGDVCHLASIGDSRAYLVTKEGAEQLTVDGDTGTSMLANQSPPEIIQEMGVAAKALRYCLGACRLENLEAGPRLVSHRPGSTPTCSQIRPLPGETLVLCTDGLVEEGVFLEPSELAATIQAGQGSSAQALADELVRLADAKQRLPSDHEPSGFGDNISCMVLKFGV